MPEKDHGHRKKHDAGSGPGKGRRKKSGTPSKSSRKSKSGASKTSRKSKTPTKGSDGKRKKHHRKKGGGGAEDAGAEPKEDQPLGDAGGTDDLGGDIPPPPPPPPGGRDSITSIGSDETDLVRRRKKKVPETKISRHGRLMKRVKKYRRVRKRRKKDDYLEQEIDEKQKKLQDEYDDHIHHQYKKEDQVADKSYADKVTGQAGLVGLGNAFVNKLLPATVLGRILGRYAIRTKKDDNGFPVFEYLPYHPYSIWFMICNILLTILFIMGTHSVFAFWENVPIGLDYSKTALDARRKEFRKEVNRTRPASLQKAGDPAKDMAWRSRENLRYLRNRYERYVYDRHIIFFISAWCLLLHNILSGWHFFFQRDYIVNYLNFWIKAIVVAGMEITKGALAPTVATIVILIVVATIFFVGAFIRLTASLAGTPNVLAIVIGRNFVIDLVQLAPGPVPCVRSVNLTNIPHFRECFTPYYKTLVYAAIIIHLYLFLSSKVYLLIFLTICRYLKNSFSVWNGRVYACLLRGGDYNQTREGRSVYPLLFKDHCTLLDLLEATDKVFSTIVESFIGLIALSYCLEVYFIFRTAFSGHNKELAKTGNYFIRPYDWVFGLLLTATHSFILLMLLRASAVVGEEAIAGLEIVRRKTMLGRKTDEELYFLLSMFTSYTSYRPMSLIGAGFFVCNKEFLIGVVATIISYFTVVYQFNPPLDFTGEEHDRHRMKIAQFLRVMEYPEVPDIHKLVDEVD